MTIKGYMLSVLAGGAACIALAIWNIPFHRVDLSFALLVAITIGLGSRVTVQIPQLKSHIAVSDVFIFLAILMFGGPLAILLAAAEALCSSWRFCNKKITVFFNAAAAAISTGAVVAALYLLELHEEVQLHGKPGYVTDFLMGLSTMSICYFFVNTSLAAVYDSLVAKSGLIDIWKRKYLWAFLTFFVGAAGAGLLVQLSDRLGFGVIVATVPIIIFLFAAYRMYLTTVQLSLQQADQAKQYAEELEERAAALRESEEKFRRAFTHAPIGIALVGFDGKWQKVNNALCDLLGYDEAFLLASTFSKLCDPDDLFKVLDGIQRIMSGTEQSFQMEVRFMHRTGRPIWGNLNVSTTGESVTRGTSLIFQIEDVTDKKHVAEKLHYEASHDALTGLPNRSTFLNRLDAALKELQQNPKYQVSVLFIDLDRFKYINDSLGHVIGDELLKAIAERLSSVMRPPDMVARLSGDEFVVLVEGRYLREKTENIADRIQARINEPFMLSGHEVFTSASIGILDANEKHSTADDVIRDADTAMYHAKRAGKARYATFDDEMRASVCETLQLDTDLRRAIQYGELEVHYQPIFDLADNTIYSLEALARWMHPTLGVISPERFVPLAEEIGLMDDLGDYILRTACSYVSSLRKNHRGLADLKLSINLSSKQFMEESILERVETILEETMFPPDRLKLEITETVFFEDHALALSVLDKLRQKGIETDIDDFGTGYSNLGYLVTLPISTLKIDRSFVMLMAENPANREVIRTIISLAENLGFKVVAEGIETEHQRDVLTNLGCDYGQGYFYSKPLSCTELERFVAEREHQLFIPDSSGDVPEASLVH